MLGTTIHGPILGIAVSGNSLLRGNSLSPEHTPKSSWKEARAAARAGWVESEHLKDEGLGHMTIFVTVDMMVLFQDTFK